MRYLIVDGMLSGTGVRDAVSGGYVALSELGISPEVAEVITSWLARYEAAHYQHFGDSGDVRTLDNIGLELCDRIAKELQGSKVGYFSTGRMEKLKFA